MTNSEITIAVITALISGLVATVINNIYYSREQKRQLKRELIKNILGYAYEMTGKYESNEYNIIKYLNQIYIIFNDSEEVMEAATIYKSYPTNENFITMIKRMCDDAKIKYNKINDSFIDSPFMMNK
ncbi:DUF6680 family protein [Clostridium sp.]|uniref:DUF6680 family protein n=1 Tax=Clostridium sp. TaxID=1506 RepID=UPI001D2968C9|nr:DUF6680 family protein [Clostridium sp.]MBS5937125.1 hypothetical protein [Clostridium sp.]